MLSPGHREARTSGPGSMAALIVICAALGFTISRAALAKPYWHDEIYTILVARLPSVSTIWAAARDGIDLLPPLNTLATRAAWTVFGAGPITTRLPALVGFCAMSVVVFVILRPRTNLPLALAGALIPVQTAAYRYAYEARGYGLMLGFFALALLAWTEAARDRRRAAYLPLLAVALAAGVWTHYYAALAYVLIGLGECVRQLARRRLDRPMWMAIGAAIVALAPLVPLVRAASAQRTGFWTQASGQGVAAVYSALMQPLLSELFSLWGAAIVVALAISLIWRRFRGGREKPFLGSPSWLPAHEIVVYGGTLLIPFAAWLLGTFILGAFTPRYALAGVVGIALSAPLLVFRLAPRTSAAGLVLCAMVALPFARNVVSLAREPRREMPDPVEQRPLLLGALSTAGPVVASGSLTFLQLWYYAPPVVRTRLVYLADPREAARLSGSDTIDRGYLVLARWTPVRVEPYDTFLSRHRQFGVYAAGSGWLLDKFAEDGISLELAGSEPGGRLYRVTR